MINSTCPASLVPALKHVMDAPSPPGDAAGSHERAGDLVALGVAQMVVDDFASHRRT
jgi:hypothetical protein